MKTSRHQRSLLTGGRLDLRTSTAGLSVLSTSTEGKGRLTPDDNVEHQDDEADHTASGAVLRGAHDVHLVVGNGGGHGQ